MNRCPLACPHHDRCALEAGHADGCNHRVCPCNEPNEAESDRDRYIALLHAMQSGVAASGHEGAGDMSPKHLRVGVNAAMVDGGALVRLLISKGVFTQAEYEEAIADGMLAEVRLYEQKLSKQHGCDVRLG